MWYVYILKCNNGKPYIGCTSDLRARLKKHQAGYVHYTKTKRSLLKMLFLGRAESRPDTS